MDSDQKIPRVRTSSNHHGNTTPPPGMGNHQLVIVSQLLQIIDRMHHIDEVFLWLTQSFSRRLAIDVIQFWTQRPNTVLYPGAELRTMICRNPTLPQQVVLNPFVVQVIERQLKERQGTMPLPVDQVFMHQQATLLAQHSLHYWGGYFLCSSAQYPPNGHSELLNGQNTSLTMIVALFTQHAPAPRLLPTVGHVLEQGISIARKRGLLAEGRTHIPPPPPITPLPAHIPAPTLPVRPIPQRHHATSLLDLIPRHVQVSSSTTGTILLSDTTTYRLYQAINGQRTLGEVLHLIQLSRSEFYHALRSLLSQRQVLLYEPGGRLVESERALQVL